MKILHPVIRVVLFFIFGLCVAFGDVSHLLFATLFMIIGYSIIGFKHLSDSWLMLKRMRWLFLSIFIVYLWFTPGHDLFPWVGNSSPSIEGLKLGFFRVYSLLLIVIGVNLLVRSIPREELIRAILWILKPFRYIGLPYERLAIRIALTFDFVGEAQTIFRNSPISAKAEVLENGNTSIELTQVSWFTRIMQRLWRIGDAAVLLFQNVLEKASRSECHNVSIPANNSPPFYQWIYVIVLIVFCTLISQVISIIRF